MEQTAAEKQYLFSNRDLLVLFIPLIIEQLLAMFVGIVDSVMVAYVSEEAVSAVSLVDNVMLLLLNVFAALATGGAVVIGQYLGQWRKEKAADAASQLVWFCMAISIVIMGITYLIRPFLLNVVFGQITEEVYRDADIYLLIVAASIPSMALFNAGAAIFRSISNSRIPMLVALFMNIVNVAGNAVLIYGLKWGVAGAAVPTLVSRVLGAVAILVLVTRKNDTLYVARTFKHRFNPSMIKKILTIGIPYSVENGLFQLGKIVILSLVASFGTAAIAANAIGSALAVFQILPGIAINLGLTTVISRCIGAGDYDQARYYNKKILIISYLLQTVVCVSIIALLPMILRLYNLSPYTEALTTQIMWIHTIGAMLIWPLSFTLPVTMRSAGDARFPMIIGVLSMFFCRVVMAYVLAGWLNIGVLAAWYAMILDWAVRTAFFLYRYFSKKWTRYQVV